MLVEQARNGDFAEFITEALSSILHPSRQNDPAIRAINRRMAQAVGIDGLARQTEAIIARIDSRPGLGNISVPTLVLVGDSDRLTPLDRAREIKEAIPHAALVVVPACGHGSTLEQPEIVNNALIEWIAG
jgi:pimeloyl-ACP methyl ester carboxylesterase